MNIVDSIEYLYCVPNRDHIMCTQSGIQIVYPIKYIYCVPNWGYIKCVPDQVYKLCTQLGTISTKCRTNAIQGPIGGKICVPDRVLYVCTRSGTDLSIPAIFWRLIRILHPGLDVQVSILFPWVPQLIEMIYKSSVAPHCLVLLHLSSSLHLDNQQDFICLLMENICNNSHLMSTSSPSYPGHVSFKEMFILFLFFLLLMYSVLSFLHNWNKNYRSINHLPYYSTFINASEIGINFSSKW